MRTQPILIKRYETRLYNTETLGYMTRADLGELVLRGDRFIIRDARTGEDVTRELLERLH